jgi:hypothetical protein
MNWFLVLYQKNIFIELFEYAIEKPYFAFVTDNHKETPKENKFKMNWNTIIRIN